MSISVTVTYHSPSADFNDAQRQATKDAGALAGLQVLRVMNEPMAAVKAYGLDKISGQQDAWKRGESVSHIFVYHLGGATLDATLLKLEDGVVEVLGDVHDSHLGGERFNSRVVNHLRELHQRDTNVNTKEDLPAYAMRKLKLEVERAKRTLSSQQSTHIDVDIKNDKIISKTLTRAKFEELNDDLFRETIKSVEQVLQEAGVKKDEVDNVSTLTNVPLLTVMRSV
jgi:heat shock protein 5